MIQFMAFSNHLVLIGFMGVGKTSVSKVLARQLSRPLYDTDALIIAEHGNMSDVMASKGEAVFRGIECNVFSELIQQAPGVISTGGGIVTHEPSRQLLKALPNVIWLQASLDVIGVRIKNDVNNERPLADAGIRDRYLSRQWLYEACASFTVHVDALSVEEVAEKIINRYG
jgi:shikimate kinase